MVTMNVIVYLVTTYTIIINYKHTFETYVFGLQCHPAVGLPPISGRTPSSPQWEPPQPRLEPSTPTDGGLGGWARSPTVATTFGGSMKVHNGLTMVSTMVKCYKQLHYIITPL